MYTFQRAAERKKTPLLAWFRAGGGEVDCMHKNLLSYYLIFQAALWSSRDGTSQLQQG